MRRLSVFNDLGRSPDSGPSRMLITTAGGAYGLTTGGYTAKRLGITSRGMTLVSSGSGADRYGAAFEALFSNEVFSGFVSRFSQRSLPIDDIATDFLKTSFRLSDTDAAACLAVIRENLNDWGLVQEYSGRRVVMLREMALEEAEKRRPSTPAQPARSEGHGTEEESRRDKGEQTRQRRGLARSNNAAQIHFNIQVHLPESAPPESYDAIFRSIAKHLLNQDDPGDE